jgi:hypothetical protein
MDINYSLPLHDSSVTTSLVAYAQARRSLAGDQAFGRWRVEAIALGAAEAGADAKVHVGALAGDEL